MQEMLERTVRSKSSSWQRVFWNSVLIIQFYDVIDRKLIINERESEIVKYIYKRYLERSDKETLPQLLQELKSKGYKNKSWISKSGNNIVGKDFDLKQLHRILSNPVYCGKIKHKDKVYDGEHQAMISQDVWDQVQLKSNKYSISRNKEVHSERPKLYGKIWDYYGNKLTSSYSYKYSKAGRYKMRYYINQEILSKGKTSSEFKRIRSDHIDTAVIDTVNTIINQLVDGVSRSKNPEVSNTILKQLQQLKITPQNFISKVILYPQHLELTLSLDKGEQTLSAEALSEIKNILADKLGNKYTLNTTSETLLQLNGNIEIQYKRFGGQLYIIKNGEELETAIEKQSYYPEDKTFIFIAKGFYWNKQIREGVYKYSRDISAATDHSVEYVKRSLLQRYLSPKILKEITSNQNIKQIGVDQLMSFNNWCWEEQENALLTSHKAVAKNKKM